MNEETLKSNACTMVGVCQDQGAKECVYYVENDDRNGCKYATGIYCYSGVATVNSMTVRLSEMTK